MKRYALASLTALFALLVLTTGGKKAELGTPEASTVADFSFLVTNEGYAPCEVSFTNLSINAKGYSWDFGNGQTSTEANPTITFDSPGLYAVTLSCTPAGDLYYNQLQKTLVVNVKDPSAGKTQVLYFSSRNSSGAGVHMIVLDGGLPLIQDFEPTDMARPYGLAADTANAKVYVTDYSLGVIYRFDADGKNPVKILDASVPGQELTGDPQGIFVLDDKIYWGRTGGIYRANLDGSNPEIYYNGGSAAPEYPLDMHYNAANGRIYVVNDKVDNSGGYLSMNFDGSNVVNHIPDIDGTAIEVDPETGKTYMAVFGTAGTAVTENGIYICNADGSGLAKIGEFGSKATWGITIDADREKLFWGYKVSNANPDGKIIRSNLDGSGQEDWLTGVSPHAMQVVWIKL